MIDTGANRTFISLQALSALQIQQIVQGEQESASLADGSTSLPVLGTLKLSVVISDISISMTTCVVRNLCIELILGMDFIQQYELILDVGKRVVSLCDRGRRITLRLNSDREDVCGSTRPVYATPITIGGLALGTTTVPTLPFSKRTSINQQLVNDHICKLTRHFGVLRTYLKIRNKFWWPEMKQSIIHYIRSCIPCQQFNVSRAKKPGRLQPIPPPEGPFQLIGMDYCGPLKRTPRGNQYVLCITDYFTRWIVAVAVPDCSAQTTAEALFNEFICKYGVPTVILTDQGTHFLNQLMEAMSKLVGYNHKYSTTYHPQSNGMIERFNATFIPQIAKLQDREDNNWDDYLSPVVFAYNTGCHSTTQYAPYELLFGREPRFPTDQSRTSFTFQRPNDYYEQLKKSMKIIHSHARENIIRKQRQYKIQYDKQRSDPHYAIDDRVLIRRHGMKNKLEPKFSITPQIIVREEHPVYVVKDEITQSETRVHINDIRPIYVEKSN